MPDLPFDIRAFSLVCAVALTGCSLLIGVDDKQCDVDADCLTSRLGLVCIEHVCMDTSNPSMGECTSDNQCGTSEPRCFRQNCVSQAVADQWLCPAADMMIKSSTVHYAFHVVDFLSGDPPKNIVVSACRNNDAACIDPVAKYTDGDGSGFAQFDLPSGFLGFFDVRSSALPALLYVTQPIVANTQGRDLPVLTPDALSATAAITGFDYDPAKGVAILEALDCAAKPAGGVQFKESVGTANQFYLIDQVPNREAKTTEYDASNNTADGGFINVQPGFVRFSAYWGVDGIELGSFNAQIRANTITFIDMTF